METVDEEATEHPLAFIDKANQDGKPFFVWYNTTAMHFRTHCAAKHKGKSGQGDYNDVMIAHDENKNQQDARRNSMNSASLTTRLSCIRRITGCITTAGPMLGIYSVPKREEHQLGRRLASTDLCALAE